MPRTLSSKGRVRSINRLAGLDTGKAPPPLKVALSAVPEAATGFSKSNRATGSRPYSPPAGRRSVRQVAEGPDQKKPSPAFCNCRHARIDAAWRFSTPSLSKIAFK